MFGGINASCPLICLMLRLPDDVRPTQPSDVRLANLILMLIVVSPLTLPANVDPDWYGWLRQPDLRLVVDLRHERELLRHISVASNLP